MKKICLSTAMFYAMASSLFAQTLFTYGSNAVSKSEFLRAYNKNKSTNIDKEKSYRDYVELYARFKLKVLAAQELKMDTLQQLKNDVDGFKSQIEEGYMNDEKTVDFLINEAEARNQLEIHAMDFFVSVNPQASVNDSTQAYKLIEAAYKTLSEGNTNYSDIANQLSTQYKTVLKASDLGYVTVFAIPYEYENMVYGLKKGAISNPYRSKKGWHIFKNISERKNMGKWKVAQILLLFPPNANSDVKNKIKQKADSIYTLVSSGADFGEMAKKISEDKITYQTAGELPEFKTGKYSLDFEDAVFALKNDGDISRPIETAYGCHIVKRLKQTPVITDKTDENYLFDIKQKVQQDARINIAKEKFLTHVLTTIHHKKNNAIRDNDLFSFADSIIKIKKTFSTPIDKKNIFSIAIKTYTVSDCLNFVHQYASNAAIYKNETGKELIKKYTETTALNYYRQHLEEYNSDFKYQIQEFKDGNMLFEIMEKNIWSKAASDTIGLKKYYVAHKQKYTWNESADAIIFNCNTAATAQSAVLALQNGKSWKTVTEESNLTIQADSGRYEISQLPTISKPKENMISTITTNATDGTATFAQILKTHAGNEQRSFDEARGLVINDYQTYLEESWIESLKQKHPIKINEVVFKSLLK